MNIDFLSLEITDFKSFIGKPQKLILGYSEPGLTFVRGRNEIEPTLGANDAGKSSMFDALAWGLYGRTVSDLRKPDLKPWVGGKNNTKVVLKLKVDNKLYNITRTTATNGLFLDGQETNQLEIDKLVGFGFKIFSHTVLLGQGRPLFFDLPPRDKLQLFSDTLGLERWEDRSWKAGEQALNLNRDQAVKEGELTGAEATLKQAQGLLENAKLRSADWEADRQDRVKKQATVLAEMDKALEAAEKKRAKADLAYDGAMTEAKSLDKEIDELGRLMIVASKHYNATSLEYADLQRQETDLKVKLSKLGVGDDCPTCGQPIKGTTIGKHKAELKKQQSVIDKKIKYSSAESLKAKNTHKAIEGQLEHARKYKQIFCDKAERAEQELNLVNYGVNDLKSRINILSSSQKEKRDETNPHHEQVQDLRRKIKQTEVLLDNIDKEIVILCRKAERSKFWIKGFKDVRLYIIEEILQELELATNALLPESGLVDWEVRYDIEKETKSGTTQRGLNVTILSPRNREAVRWESWGGGVGQRLRVVGALALADVLLAHAGVKTNLEILDEPTQHLSTEGVQDVCGFLSARAQQLGKNIFYVDHKAVESAHFASVLTVVKTKTGSHIMEE